MNSNTAGLQIVRDWVERFNARGPEGLIDGKARGNKPKLCDSQRQALVEIVERGPTPEIHGIVRWRLTDLVKWLTEQFEVTLDETNVSRELKKLCYAKLSARPRHHAQDKAALEAFKKGLSRRFLDMLAQRFAASSLKPEFPRGRQAVVARSGEAERMWPPQRQGQPDGPSPALPFSSSPRPSAGHEPDHWYSSPE